jgi:hypothetical protein
MVTLLSLLRNDNLFLSYYFAGDNEWSAALFFKNHPIRAALRPCDWNPYTEPPSESVKYIWIFPIRFFTDAFDYMVKSWRDDFLAHTITSKKLYFAFSCMEKSGGVF